MTPAKQDAGATRYAAQIAETREYARNKRRGQADDLLQQLVSVCPCYETASRWQSASTKRFERH